MPKYIDAEKKVHIQIYDDMHEEYITVERTIASCLDCYTDEGCPEPADVEEVKHGKWAFNRDGYICCSKCSCQPYRESRTIDFDNRGRCPNCGAKMDGKDGQD